MNFLPSARVRHRAMPAFLCLLVTGSALSSLPSASAQVLAPEPSEAPPGAIADSSPAPAAPTASAPPRGQVRIGGQPINLGFIFDGTFVAGRSSVDEAQVRGLELTIGAPVDPWFDLQATIAYSPEEVALEEAYVTSHLPWGFQTRLGRTLVPFGELNTFHIHDQPQVDDPRVLTNFFGPEGLNAIGGHLEWMAPTSNPALSLLIGLYNRASGEDENNEVGVDRDGDGNADETDGFLDGPIVFNVNNPKRGPLLLARAATFLSWDEDRHQLKLGTSYLADKNDASGSSRSSVWGLDAKYRHRLGNSGRGFTLAGEYLVHDREEPQTSLFPANGGRDLHMSGYYAYGQFEFDRRWSLGYRFDHSNTAYLNVPSANLLDPNRKNTITAHSIYGEFRPSEFSRLRLQYTAERPIAGYDLNGNNVLGDDRDDRVMIQFTHLIGWHPAHRF